MHIVSSKDVGKANRNRIYRLIARKGPISKAEIAQRLKISLPTVAQNIRALIKDGFVHEDGSLESTGGRKAVALSRVKDARIAVGVDVTKRHVAVVVVDLDGGTVKSARKSLPFSTKPAYARALGRIVDRQVGESGIQRDRILGVGVALPGILGWDGLKFSSHVLSLDNCECEAVTRHLDYPLMYCNDANAAGLAEMWTDGSPETFVYLSLSNSVGGAVILDRKLYVGEGQRGGEFGHLTLVRGGERCYCGMRGCIDPYCNATVLSSLTKGDLDAFFGLLAAGDRKARSAWNRYLDYLATAVNDLRMAFDCDVVLGGYVGAHFERYIGDLRQRAAKINTFVACGGDYVKVCRRLVEPSATGAALLHIENCVNRI